jgi:DNA processing protein
MSETTDTAILALMMVPGAGSLSVHRAIAAAKQLGCGLDLLFEKTAKELLERLPGHPERLTQLLLLCTPELCERAARLIQRVVDAGGLVLPITHPNYPASLLNTLGHSAPPLLFCAGDRSLLVTDSAAIVGSRVASDDGLKLAKRSAEVLAKSGVVIVSGGAAGVDTSAHEGALGAGGRTVVVLPEGILNYRMPVPIAEGFEDRRVCIVSEFAPDMPWQTQAAVVRNATISALARMVLVIEPRKTGGSIRTAQHATQQGKRVLVYLPESSDPAEKALAKGFPMNILDENNRFLPERLLGFWKTAPLPERKQKELF